MCTVWGSDKSQMSKIQEERSIPVNFFICFHSHERLRCSGVQVQLSKFASESVSEPKLDAKSSRLVILSIIYVQVQWFILQSVWKDRLLTWIIGSVLQWSIYFKIARKHIVPFCSWLFWSHARTWGLHTRQWPAHQAVCLMGIIWHQKEEEKKKRFSFCVFFC